MIKRLRFDEVVMMSFIAVGAGALVVAGVGGAYYLVSPAPPPAELKEEEAILACCGENTSRPVQDEG